MTCDNCHEREATSRWGGESAPIDAMRRMHSLPWWCEYCMAKEQLKYAQRVVDRLDDLKATIAKYETPQEKHTEEQVG